MKAKVIKTGEVVEVYRTTTGWASENLNKTRFFEETELDFDYREWEVFRREAAKDILCAVLAGGIANGANGFDAQKEELVNASIGMADELIQRLKEE